MRFILNFIFFGVLFYAIHVFSPDLFDTLVGWANAIYEFLREIVLRISEKIQDWKGGRSAKESFDQSLFLVPLFFGSILKK